MQVLPCPSSKAAFTFPFYFFLSFAFVFLFSCFLFSSFTVSGFFCVPSDLLQMGYSRGSSYIDWKDAPNGPTGAKFKVIPFSVEDEYDDDEPETGKIFKRNMIWDLGLGCFLPIRRRGSCSKDKKQGGKDNGDSDNDEAWLLAESGSLGPDFVSAVDPKSVVADPQSVHSSFRFSFGSQMDLEGLTRSSSVSAATVLMVNLSTDLSESQSHDMKWRRIQSLERSISPVAGTLVRFSYSEIRAATGNFSKDRVLGKGAMSCVFKGRVGFLRKAVAIKRLVKEDKESTKAFCRELMIASSLHNRNVVLLMGFCIDPEEGLFLVYKFVSGGSLQHYLHANRGVKGGSLPWSVRYKIAIGITEAIAYLHNGSEKCVVHRDIKPSNILLSSKKKPKLCDFGLATWTPAPSVPFLCKTVKGTFGYLAPEYFQHGKVSDKTDVYAFGVVLLELITGRKPIEANRQSGDENLVLWAKALLQQGGSIKELLDPMLTISSRDSNQLMKMIQAAAACIESEESRRPSINQIVAILKGDENYSSSRNISTFSRNDSIIDSYSNLQHKKSEMRSYFALAMLGVSDHEGDNHLYCR